MNTALAILCLVVSACASVNPAPEEQWDGGEVLYTPDLSYQSNGGGGLPNGGWDPCRAATCNNLLDNKAGNPAQPLPGLR